MDVPMAVGSGIIILGAAVWIICAVAAYQRAPGLGRRAWVWGLVTLIGGPLALFILVVLPRPKHPNQPSHHASASQPVDPHHNAEPHHHSQHKHHDNAKHGH